MHDIQLATRCGAEVLLLQLYHIRRGGRDWGGGGFDRGSWSRFLKRFLAAPSSFSSFASVKERVRLDRERLKNRIQSTTWRRPQFGSSPPPPTQMTVSSLYINDCGARVVQVRGHVMDSWFHLIKCALGQDK